MGKQDRSTLEALVAVFREEAGRLTGSLVRQLGDFELDSPSPRMIAGEDAPVMNVL